MASVTQEIANLNPSGIKTFGEDYVKQNELLGHSYHDWPREFLKNYVLHLMREFPLADRKVLDVGCAYGREVLAFIRWGHADAFGVDVCKPMIDGSPWKKELKSRIRISSANDTGFKDNFFDLLHTQQTLEHLNPDKVNKAEQEFLRILKPGGFLYATLDVVDNEGMVEGRGRAAKNEQDLTHTCLMPMAWWRNIFKEWTCYPGIERRMTYWPEEDRRASVLVLRKP